MVGIRTAIIMNPHIHKTHTHTHKGINLSIQQHHNILLPFFSKYRLYKWQIIMSYVGYLHTSLSNHSTHAN